MSADDNPLNASFGACAALVKAGDPDRFLSAQSAPPESRKKLMAIYAVNLEIARAPWMSAEPVVAQMRLRWWADEIAKIYQGQRVDSHEILLALRDVIFDHNLPQSLFDAMTTARIFDIYSEPHESREDFGAYINATAGSVMELAARVLGGGAEMLNPIRDFAYGAGVANLLRASAELHSRGRHPLLANIVEIVEDASAKLHNARAHRRSIPHSIRPALLAGWRADATLHEARKRPASIAAGLLEESPARKMLSLRWKTLSGRW